MTMLALRGIPSITWGTEDALKGAHEPANRGDMVFDPKAPLRADITGDLAFRRAHPAITGGLTRVVDLGPRRLALLRLRLGDAVLLALEPGHGQGHRDPAPGLRRRQRGEDGDRPRWRRPAPGPAAEARRGATGAW